MPHHFTDELIIFIQQIQHVLIVVIFVNTTGLEHIFLLSVVPSFSAVIPLTVNKIVQNVFS